MPEQPEQKQETVGEAVAAMRRYADILAAAPVDPLAQDIARLLREYADRIERAAKRDYEEAKAYFEKLHDGPSMICTAKNCALRNAAEDIVEQVKAEASFGHFAPVVLEDPAPGNSAAMREALKYARKVLALNGFAEPVVRCDAALAAPPRACDVLAKEQLANDIIKAIEEGVPGWAKVSELEKSLAYAVVNATVNAAYGTNIVKTDEPNDEQHGGAPAPDGAERGANGYTK